MINEKKSGDENLKDKYKISNIFAIENLKTIYL